MQTSLLSYLRHWITWLLTTASLGLIGWLSLTGDDKAALGKAFDEVAGPLTVMLSIVLMALYRAAVGWMQRKFSREQFSGSETPVAKDGTTTPSAAAEGSAAAPTLEKLKS